MPYVSDAQRRLFHALESKGEMPHSTVKKWDKASKGKKLPEHVHKKQAMDDDTNETGEGNSPSYGTGKGCSHTKDGSWCGRCAMAKQLSKAAAVLSAKGRKHIKAKNFALGKGRYPIHDSSHARAALSRVAQHGTPSEQATVRAKVHAKYPGIGKEKTAMSMNPDTAFRAAFLEELARTGAVAKVAAHSEPFIDDSDDAVSQEDVEQYGHGKGMGKAKKRKPVPKTAPAGEPSELARAISKVLGGSGTPAGGAAAAIMKSAESVSERMAEVKQKAQAGAKAYHEGERTPGLGERMENVQKSVLPKPKQPTHPAIRAAKTTGQIIGNVATSPWR